MTQRQKVAAGVVAVVVIAAAVWWLRAGAGDHPSAAPPPQAGRAAVHVPAAPHGRGGHAADDPPRDPATELPDDDAADDADGSDGSNGSNAAHALRGRDGRMVELSGAIAGRVVDPAGKPIAGAHVAALPAGDIDLVLWRQRHLPDAVTDAAGAFQLTRLPEGSYRVWAAPSRKLAAQRRARGATGGDKLATTGDRNVELVLAPDGSIRGKLAFGDGSVPGLFSAATPGAQHSFGGGDGSFVLDAIPPGTYHLELRGPDFQARSVEVTVAANAATDVGTITVARGRAIAGTVVASGKPVPGATVYAGRNILGGGASASNPVSAAAQAIAAATHSTTTDAQGAFSLNGFGDGDLAVVAEHDAIGRSRALRLSAVAPGQTELVLTLEAFGALHGTVTGTATIVTCQSTSTPGAVFTVPTGSDGSYRFDRLAPDTYKVSATVGSLRSGLHYYAQQITVASGQDAQLDLRVEPGSVTLDVTLTAAGGLGLAIVYLAPGAIHAATEGELAGVLAATATGASQRATARGGTASLTAIAPGAYSLCTVPLPREVQGTAALAYMDQHGTGLPARCQAIAIAASPATQSVEVAVQVPPFVDDGATH